MPLTPAEPTFPPDAVSLFLVNPLTVKGASLEAQGTPGLQA